MKNDETTSGTKNPYSKSSFLTAALFSALLRVTSREHFSFPAAIKFRQQFVHRTLKTNRGERVISRGKMRNSAEKRGNLKVALVFTHTKKLRERSRRSSFISAFLHCQALTWRKRTTPCSSRLLVARLQGG